MPPGAKKQKILENKNLNKNSLGVPPGADFSEITNKIKETRITEKKLVRKNLEERRKRRTEDKNISKYKILEKNHKIDIVETQPLGDYKFSKSELELLKNIESDGSINFDKINFSDNKISSKLNYLSGKYFHDINYFSGNIYEKLKNIKFDDILQKKEL